MARGGLWRATGGFASRRRHAKRTPAEAAERNGLMLTPALSGRPGHGAAVPHCLAGPGSGGHGAAVPRLTEADRTSLRLSGGRIVGISACLFRVHMQTGRYLWPSGWADVCQRTPAREFNSDTYQTLPITSPKLDRFLIAGGSARHPAAAPIAAGS